jgi:hypothetical protein
MDGNNDPIKNSQKGDESGEDPQLKSWIQSFSFDSKKEGDQSKPGQELEIEIREGENEKNS